MNSDWFECKARFDKTMDTGVQKKATETYLVDALSFTEAERRFIEEMTPRISGEFTVKDIKRASLSEIFESDDAAADRWFKAKVAYINLDEKTGAEKRSNQQVLIQGTDIREAVKTLDKRMEGTLGEWVLVSIAETQIMDVFRYKKVEG